MEWHMIRAALTVEEALEGMKALEPKIKNYARLVVRKGVNVKPGQEVVIAELDQHAVVLSRPDKNGMVEVRAGILKTKVPLTGLCAPDKMDKRTQKQEPPRTRTRVELNHDRKSSMELNLLGYTVEEALAEVDRFLDHAMLSNQNTVYIIHGNGTGALRNAIQKHLRTHRGVKSFRLGRYGEGESGVTVVELK
jgi:DNA mismatch repair protein MutS2